MDFERWLTTGPSRDLAGVHRRSSRYLDHMSVMFRTPESPALATQIIAQAAEGHWLVVATDWRWVADCVTVLGLEFIRPL